jgi:hypothetical protein
LGFGFQNYLKKINLKFLPITTLYGKSFHTERPIMAEKKSGMSVPVRQEDIWSVVRLLGVKARTWQGEETKKNGMTVYRVEVLGIFLPGEGRYGTGGEYFEVSVPMTEEEYTKLSHEKADAVLHFDKMTAHFYEKKSFTAVSVSVVRPTNQVQVPKP